MGILYIIYSCLPEPSLLPLQQSTLQDNSSTVVTAHEQASATESRGSKSPASTTTGHSSPVINTYNTFNIETSLTTEEIRSLIDTAKAASDQTSSISTQTYRTASSNIQVHLRVLSIVSNSVDCTFLIQNNYPRNADNVRIFFFTPATGGEMNVKKPFQLKAHQAVTLQPMLGLKLWLPPSPQSAEVTLSIHYAIIEQATTNTFLSHYSFSLFRQSLHVGDYPPIGVDRSHAPLSVTELQHIVRPKHFLTSPTGAHAFRYQFANALKDGPHYFFNTPDRSLFYNPKTEKITFRTILASGRQIHLTEDVTGRVNHFIAVCWGPNDAGLTVDLKGEWPPQQK